MIPYACKVCNRLDVEGIIGHAADRCHPVTKNVTSIVTTCSQCVTKDAELARLRNQIATIIERDRKPKRDRAAYMREYRKQA